ncbi:MAG: pyroglutamyl-peptidase I [Clostridia bacterium]|nr:pyroglutamyl-peptidase I [Clostridia bacterium]
MSILITGFDPFDGANINPSWAAVELVPEEVCGQRVYKMQLPTIFGKAAELLCAEIERVKPAVVMCCGVANGRTGVTPELVAINYRQARIADNIGQCFFGVPIAPGGDAAYMTRLPVNDMVEAIREAGIPAYLSYSAGAYVCNDVYYALLQSEKAFGHRGLFVHVPGTEAVDAPKAAQALAICLEKALQHNIG